MSRSCPRTRTRSVCPAEILCGPARRRFRRAALTTEMSKRAAVCSSSSSSSAAAGAAGEGEESWSPRRAEPSRTSAPPPQAVCGAAGQRLFPQHIKSIVEYRGYADLVHRKFSLVSRQWRDSILSVSDLSYFSVCDDKCAEWKKSVFHRQPCRLHIDGTTMDAADIVELIRACPRLTHLHVGSCTDDESPLDFSFLSDSVEPLSTTLETLEMDDFRVANIRFLLARLPLVSSFRFGHRNIFKEHWPSPHPLGPAFLRQLTRMDLNGCSASAEELAGMCKDLSVQYLSCCNLPQLVDQVIRVSHMRSLIHLNVSETKMTNKGVIELLAACPPTLQSFDCSHIAVRVADWPPEIRMDHLRTLSMYKCFLQDADVASIVSRFSGLRRLNVGFNVLLTAECLPHLGDVEELGVFMLESIAALKDALVSFVRDSRRLSVLYCNQAASAAALRASCRSANESVQVVPCATPAIAHWAHEMYAARSDDATPRSATLVSMDGQSFEWESASLALSGLVRSSAVEDDDGPVVVALPFATGAHVRYVTDFCAHHARWPAPKIPKPLFTVERGFLPLEEMISKWDEMFLASIPSADMICELLHVATRMDIPVLADLLCAKLASAPSLHIRCTPADVRAYFNLVEPSDQLSAEEKADVCAQYAYYEDFVLDAETDT